MGGGGGKAVSQRTLEAVDSLTETFSLLRSGLMEPISTRIGKDDLEFLISQRLLPSMLGYIFIHTTKYDFT